MPDAGEGTRTQVSCCHMCFLVDLVGHCEIQEAGLIGLWPDLWMVHSTMGLAEWLLLCPFTMGFKNPHIGNTALATFCPFLHMPTAAVISLVFSIPVGIPRNPVS